MQIIQNLKIADWLYQYKKKIILCIITVIVLSIAVTTIFITAILRNRLIADSKQKTHELSEVVQLSLRELMLARDPGKIQNMLVTMGNARSSVVKAFILDKHGRVVYSSDAGELGLSIDRFQDLSCKGCHSGPVGLPHDTTMIITVDNEQVLRNVGIMFNEKACHGCHTASDRINGKLIIDRSLRPTRELIRTVNFMILGFGLLCLAFLVSVLSRILSRGVDKYIQEILIKSTELTLLYGIVESLSKTIEIEELKRIVVEIVKEALEADEIDIILPKAGREYSGISWKKSDNLIKRRKFNGHAALRPIIDAWLGGDLAEDKISDDRREVYMPVSRSGSRLGLIIIRKDGAAFDAQRLELVKAIGNHIAVSFENAALYHIAITDELTGLYSKRHFRSSIEKKFTLFLDYGEKLTLLMIDIDNFKQVNDTYGHPAGDSVLREIGQCIMSSTRDGDTDFRYGGEEFAVILPATDAGGGEVVAERMRQSIENHIFTIGDTNLIMTVSIGLASCPANAQTIKDLIMEADKALYEAKRQGKNRVVLSAASPLPGN